MQRVLFSTEFLVAAVAATHTPLTQVWGSLSQGAGRKGHLGDPWVGQSEPHAPRWGRHQPAEGNANT